MAGLADPEMAANALSGMMRGWAQVDGREAFAYAAENRADPQMAELLASTAEQWALGSTPDEIGLLLADVSSLEDSDLVIGLIALPLARIDPAMTMEAVSKIENDRSRSMATAVVMGEWARTDIHDAENRYKAMSFDQSKQQAFWSIFNASMKQGRDPQNILALVEDLSDPQAISRSLVHIAEYTTITGSSQGSQALADALLEYLDSSDDLTGSAKIEILNKLNPQP